MGTNNYQTKNPGDVITHEDPNQYKTGLTGDVVPRNTSGVPTDIFGSLGATIYRWLNTFTEKLYIGAVASGLSIEEDTGTLIFKIAGVEKARINASGLTISSHGLAKVISSNFNFTTTSKVEVDVTNATGTITTKGGDVQISFTNTTTGNLYSGIVSGSDTSGTTNYLRAEVFVYRDGVKIAQILHTVGGDGSTGDLGFVNSLGTFTDYNLAAGTYAYKLRLKTDYAGTSAGKNFGVDGRMIVREMPS